MVRYKKLGEELSRLALGINICLNRPTFRKHL